MLASFVSFTPSVPDGSDVVSNDDDASSVATMVESEDLDATPPSSRCAPSRELSSAQVTVLVVGLNAIIVFCTIFLTLDLDWSSMEEATCFSEDKGCYCELIHPEDTTIRQEVNAWSNLVFVVAGLFMIVHACGIDAGGVPMTRVLGIAFGSIQILIGTTSFLYHASLTLVFNFFDVAAAILMASFLLVYAWSRIFNLSRRSCVIAYLLLLACSLPLWRFYIPLALMIFGIGFELYHLMVQLKKKQDVPTAMFWLYPAAVILLLLSILVSDMSIAGVECSRSSWFQSHALWHILMSFCMIIVYVYFVLENNIPQNEESDKEDSMDNSGGTKATVDIESAGELPLDEVAGV